MVLIVDLASPTDADMASQVLIYTGAQLLAVKSSWTPNALYSSVAYSPSEILFISTSVGVLPLEEVPPLEEANKAHADLERKPNALGCVFSHYGYVAREYLPHLRRKCKLFDLADRMRRLKQWLQKNQAALRNGFMDDLLRSEEKDWRLSSWGLSEVMCLMDEGSLSVPVIETLLEQIQLCYKDKVFCILPRFIADQRKGSTPSQHWGARIAIQEGSVTKAFAVIRMPPDHWGLLCVDFSRREVSFGDSMDQGVARITEDVRSAIHTVVSWVRAIGLIDSSWPSDVASLSVPQQPHGSGSGGVIALNTIECSINPSIEPWTHPRSAYHRIRYLQVASGYCKVRQPRHS